MSCTDGSKSLTEFYGTDLINKGYQWFYDEITRKKAGGDYFPKLEMVPGST